MPQFVKSTPVPVPADDLFAWHARFGGFDRLCPPWAGVRLYAATAGLTNGARWVIRTPGGLPWVADLHGVEPGRKFEDRMRFVPFTTWNHAHRFETAGETATMTERIDYRTPFGLLDGAAKSALDQLFTFRHARLVRDLTRHAAFPGKRLTIAVTGSTGLIGRDLVAFLSAGGHRIVRLVTGPVRPAPLDDTAWVKWDPMQKVPAGVLHGVDAVIHLASEPIAEGRWTRSKRRLILDSRTVPTRHLAEAAGRAKVPVFLTASAVGYYGDRGESVLSEPEPSGAGFLADVCRQWEAAADGFPNRLVKLRIGTVLTPRGGAVGRQWLAFQLGLGAVLGSGEQFVPWVGIDDCVAAMHFAALTDSVRGPINVTAPAPVRQRDFAATLATILNRPRFLTLPAGPLKALVGDVAEPALLASMNVVPTALTAAGFRFDRLRLDAELRFLLGR